jgi:hypothetical protein
MNKSIQLDNNTIQGEAKEPSQKKGIRRNLKHGMTLQSTILKSKHYVASLKKEETAGNEVRAKRTNAKAIESYLLQRKQLLEMKDQVSHTCAEMESTMEESRKKVKQSQTLMHYYKDKIQKICDKTRKMTVVASLKSALNGCFPNKHPLTKAKLLMDEISSSRLFNGEPLKLMQIFAQHYVRDLFKPWRMLKAADELSVGAFKTATVKALNKVRDYERLGLFSSASSVDRARAKLDQYAFELIGYERHGTVYGEVFYLNFENALHYLLKACELDQLATTENIKLSLSIVGADLFKDWTHVSAGIKITDTQGVHPVTKQPLFSVDADSNEEKIV